MRATQHEISITWKQIELKMSFTRSQSNLERKHGHIDSSLPHSLSLSRSLSQSLDIKSLYLCHFNRIKFLQFEFRVHWIRFVWFGILLEKIFSIFFCAFLAHDTQMVSFSGAHFSRARARSYSKSNKMCLLHTVSNSRSYTRSTYYVSCKKKTNALWSVRCVCNILMGSIDNKQWIKLFGIDVLEKCFVFYVIHRLAQRFGQRLFQPNRLNIVIFIFC